MSILGKKLRLGTDFVSFMCPGCREMHAVKVVGTDAWQFNGSGDKPTFMPSYHVKTGHFMNEHKGDKCWCTFNSEKVSQGEKPAPFNCRVCHSWIKDGQIEFLSDSTHNLAGQIVELPDIAEAQ